MCRTALATLFIGLVLTPALLASEAPESWQQLFDQASLAQRNGRPSQARNILKRALGVATPAEAIFTRYALGGTEEVLARYSDAEKNYIAGLELLRAHNVPEDQRNMWEARFHNARGVIQLHMRGHATAAIHFRAALEQSRQAGEIARIDHASALSNLADVLYRQGFHEEAFRGFAQSINLYKSAQPLATLPLCYAMANAALVALRLGDIARADQLSREALEQFTASLGELNPRRGGFLRIRAEILARTHRHREAKALRKQAEDLPSDPAMGAFLDVGPFGGKNYSRLTN